MVLHGDCDTASSDERVITKTTLLAVALIRHQKGEFVVRASRSKVGSFLEVVLPEIRVVIFPLA
jgi:hypothetical protein